MLAHTLAEEELPNTLEAWVESHFPGAQFIAQGGQRSVYRVLTPEDSALKIWAVTDSVQHERHVREVSGLGRMSHEGLPRVVAHLSQIEIQGQLYAMYQEQWLDAPSVAKQRHNFPLPEADLGAFMDSGLETLVHLHAEKIVHRDISFGNVLWDGTRVYLVDLGLAKHLDLDSITSTGEAVGMTLASASPEQLQGVGTDLRPSTDVYSFGVIAFVVATGRHPFIDDGESLTVQQLLTRQTSKDFRVSLPASAGVIGDFLAPVAMFRPSADDLLQQVR
jgi:serine/threonine-protein kinase